MPEASTHVDDPAEPRKHKVRFSWELGHVETIPIAHAVNDAAHRYFRRCIFGADQPHVLRAPLWGKVVSHTARSSGRSEMSFSRSPLTMILTRFAESSASNCFTAAMSSGRAK